MGRYLGMQYEIRPEVAQGSTEFALYLEGDFIGYARGYLDGDETCQEVIRECQAGHVTKPQAVRELLAA